MTAYVAYKNTTNKNSRRGSLTINDALRPISRKPFHCRLTDDHPSVTQSQRAQRGSRWVGWKLEESLKRRPFSETTVWTNDCMHGIGRHKDTAVDLYGSYSYHLCYEKGPKTTNSSYSSYSFTGFFTASYSFSVITASYSFSVITAVAESSKFSILLATKYLVHWSGRVKKIRELNSSTMDWMTQNAVK